MARRIESFSPGFLCFGRRLIAASMTSGIRNEKSAVHLSMCRIASIASSRRLYTVDLLPIKLLVSLSKKIERGDAEQVGDPADGAGLWDQFAPLPLGDVLLTGVEFPGELFLGGVVCFPEGCQSVTVEMPHNFLLRGYNNNLFGSCQDFFSMIGACHV